MNCNHIYMYVYIYIYIYIYMYVYVYIFNSFITINNFQTLNFIFSNLSFLVVHMLVYS